MGSIGQNAGHQMHLNVVEPGLILACTGARKLPLLILPGHNLAKIL